ncbi:hypothetical protein [Okeania sp.]|uniref:hypothetical protein n=1 Tax=Okeania sp. TaxID=3100323 RepID=UPI002B4B70AA|nr:hypothetical protein [Okeania sp.]MEB3341135.1 hypothetical protein [Okeania sp.]
MQSNSDKFPEKDSENIISEHTKAKLEQSVLLHNISIAALVGVIAFAGVSTLIIATIQNSVNEMEKTEIK